MENTTVQSAQNGQVKGVIMYKINGKKCDGRMVLFCKEPVVGFFCVDRYHTDIRTEEIIKCDCPEKKLTGICLFIDRGFDVTTTVTDDDGELCDG